VLVQIYGVTTPEDAEMVNELAPDHVGVVLDEGFEAWDSVDARMALAIASKLTDVVVVALSFAVQRDEILRTVEALSPGVLHLARALDGMAHEALADLKAEIAPVGLMVTAPVVGSDSVNKACDLARAADFLLLDSAHPATGVVGATGLVHDWSLSRQIVASSDARVILAGGLGPDNVLDAIHSVRPFGVDSETKTSRADDRRRKDLDKVRHFIERARSATVPDVRQ
jgi:phosphoribosylanthranilate isomerase